MLNLPLGSLQQPQLGGKDDLLFVLKTRLPVHLPFPGDRSESPGEQSGVWRGLTVLFLLHSAPSLEFHPLYYQLWAGRISALCVDIAASLNGNNIHFSTWDSIFH